MNAKAEFANHIVDLLDSFGPVDARRMFGGFGIFHQGLMFGLVSDSTLYLKADAESKGLFEDEGSTPFSYIKQGREFTLSYYLAPETFFEDTDEAIRWARLAFDAALRAPKKKRKKR